MILSHLFQNRAVYCYCCLRPHGRGGSSQPEAYDGIAGVNVSYIVTIWWTRPKTQAFCVELASRVPYCFQFRFVEFFFLVGAACWGSNHYATFFSKVRSCVHLDLNFTLKTFCPLSRRLHQFIAPHVSLPGRLLVQRSHHFYISVIRGSHFCCYNKEENKRTPNGA